MTTDLSNVLVVFWIFAVLVKVCYGFYVFFVFKLYVTNYRKTILNVSKAGYKLACKRSTKVKPNLEIFQHLPDDIIMNNIITCLDVSVALKGISLSCKRFRYLVINSNRLWQTQVELLGLPPYLNLYESLVKELSWYEVFKKIQAYHRTVKKRLLYSNYLSQKKQLTRRNFYLSGKSLKFQGIYTNGGCYGDNLQEKRRFWIDNLFASGSTRDYCSAKSNFKEIETMALYAPNMKMKCRRRAINRRKAIQWIFSGLRIPTKLLNAVDNVELESLLVQAVMNNVDQLVQVKAKIWEQKLKKMYKAKYGVRSNTKTMMRSLIKFGAHYDKFVKIYNSFSRTRTKDIHHFIKKYVNLKGFSRTLLFSCRLLLRTINKYFDYLDHRARLKKVLKLTQRKVKFKNGLLAFKNKILAEQESLKESISRVREPEIFPGIEKVKNNTNSLLDRKTFEAHGVSLCLVDTVKVSRKAYFTSPLSTGAILGISCDLSRFKPSFSESFAITGDLVGNQYSHELLTSHTYEEIEEKVKLGRLPPILADYKCKSIHVVEFDIQSSMSSHIQPIIWFTFESKQPSRFPIRLSLNAQRNLSSKYSTDFVYKLDKPRCLQAVNVKLINSRKAPRESNNIDVSSILFYGYDLKSKQTT